MGFGINGLIINILADDTMRRFIPSDIVHLREPTDGRIAPRREHGRLYGRFF